MNEVIAEIRLDNIYNSFIYISKSLEKHNSDSHYRDEGTKLQMNQGFAWYQDFVSFYMLSDYQSYWVKIAVAESLEIDPVIAVQTKNFTEKQNHNTSVILLPFEVTGEERIHVFADATDGAIFSFPLYTGHYQLLFQNRFFTREEIEAEPNFNCEDADYDDWDDEMELCLLTFIPTEVPIEPKILASRRRNAPTDVVLYDRKLHPNGD